MAQLAHPNVVTVFEVGLFDDQLFVAMEYVRGETLRDWVEKQPRSWREIVDIMRAVGEGLYAAHRAEPSTATSNRRTCSSATMAALA